MASERNLTPVKHSRAKARRQQTAERLIYALAKASLTAEDQAQVDRDLVVSGQAAIFVDHEGSAKAVHPFDRKTP